MRPTYSFSAIIAVLVTLCTQPVSAQKCDVDSGFRGSYFRVGYEQRELVKFFRSLDEVPENVRNRLDEYLNKKLGGSFRERLKFEEGEWLDRVKLKEQFPSVYQENAELGSYDLLFFFSDTDKGLAAFFSKMVLNEDGSVKVDIRLPDIGSNPEKSEIISCAEAYSIAATRDFPIDLSSAQFEYSEEQKSFVWIITDSREVDPDDSLLMIIGRFNGTYRRIEISANTGAVIRIYKYTIGL